MLKRFVPSFSVGKKHALALVRVPRSTPRSNASLNRFFSSRPSFSKHDYEYDLVVLGAGSGGIAGARRAAEYGARVAIVESSPRLGGTCVNYGCIPKKLYMYAGEFGQSFADAKGYGWDVNATFNWRTLKNNKNKEIARLNGIYDQMLANSGVKIISGKGRIEDPHTVSVGSSTITSKTILLATGNS